jgi:hypothetical protein
MRPLFIVGSDAPTNNHAEQAYCWRRGRMGYLVHYQDRVERRVVLSTLAMLPLLALLRTTVRWHKTREVNSPRGKMDLQNKTDQIRNSFRPQNESPLSIRTVHCGSSTRYTPKWSTA